MLFQKDFMVPAIPIIWDVATRYFLLSEANWYQYFSAGNIVVIFSIWASVSAVKRSVGARIPTDDGYQNQAEKLRLTLISISAFGLILYGAIGLVEAVNLEYGPKIPEMLDSMSRMIGVFSLLYAIISLVVIVMNRKAIEGIVYA